MTVLTERQKCTLLWEGNWREAGYTGPRKASLAFCRFYAGCSSWTTPDDLAQQVDGCYRLSGLYSSRWDQPIRPDGITHGQAVIKQAISGILKREEKKQRVAQFIKSSRKDVVKASKEPRHRLFQLYSIQELLAIKEPTWLLDRLISPKSLGMLYGPPGAGKTFVVLDLLFSVVKGQPWLGKKVLRPLRVAYGIGEGQLGLRQRLKSALDLYPLSPEEENRFVVMVDLPQLFEGDRHDGYKAFLRSCRSKLRGFDLLVLDTMHLATAGANENSAQDASKIIQACQTITKELGCAVILVHHSTKDSKTDRGSSAFRGAMDFVFEVNEASGVRRLSHRKSKDSELTGSFSFTLQSVRESCFVEWNGSWKEQPQQERSPKRQEILDALSESDGAMSRKDLEEATDISTSHLKRLLSALTKEGFILCEKRLQGSKKEIFYYSLPE